MPAYVTIFSAQRLVLLLAVLIASTAVAAAQSGRRGPTKSPAPAPEPVLSPTSASTRPQTPARIQLLVAVNDPSGFDRVPLVAPEIVLTACGQRLKEAKEVATDLSSRRMTRAEAISAAKAETTRYVVFLEVKNERAEFGAESSGQDRLYINFAVFEPGTAKLKKSGRAQHSTGRAGNVGVTVPGIGDGLYSEYAIREAARQAADRILEAFQIRRDGWPR